MQDLKYPIGKFSFPLEFTESGNKSHIQIIQDFPEKLWDLVGALTQKDLLKPYRPGGWNIRQVIHHCADSHMNAYIRLKLALTEDNPVIKPYKENLWAELPDTALSPITTSVEILKGVHFRWIVLLNSLKGEDWLKTYMHPESGRKTSMQEMTALYAWHCQHHFAHIEQALKTSIE